MKEKLLIIEDDEDLRKSLIELLPGDKFELISASCGNAGLAKFQENKPSLVITDILMPDREGISVIIEIKKLSPETKIIAISGGGQFNKHDVLKIAKHIGADKILAKPFTYDEIHKVLDEIKK